ncbi:MAG: type II secretion system F family protein [Opitutaceae bacterium]
MRAYSYRAYDAAGRTITGSLEADGVEALENRLRAAGQWLLEAKEGRVERNAPVSRLRLRRADVIGIFVQLTLLLRAGITLPNALQRLAEDNKGTRSGIVLATLLDQVSVGVPLHRAMAAYPRVFTPEVTAVVEAGEVSGQLPEVFASLQSYFEWCDQLIADVRQALLYPVIVLVAAVGLVLMLFTVVVPKFVTLLTELALEVPTLTRVVMGISRVLLQGWPALLALAIALPVGLKLALRSPQFAIWLDRQKMELPVFGSLVGMIALSRFSHNLALLYRSGIPLLRGLEICRNLVGNRAIAAAIGAVHESVLEGRPLSKSLAEHPVFPQTLVTMLATGETSGTLDVALQGIADYYNKIIPRRIKVVFAVFNPAMMLSLIGVVGIVALAVILPILQLWNAR